MTNALYERYMADKVNGTFTNKKGETFPVRVGENGFKFIDIKDVQPVLHIVAGNTKTGKEVSCYGHSIELTCNHAVECYMKKDGTPGNCYGLHGLYNMPSNQEYIAENFKFFKVYGREIMAKAIIEKIVKGKFEYHRWFTVGDIPNFEFLQMMIDIANALPSVKFWGYTKKYNLVNRYVKEHGDSVSCIPENLVIIFSHWMNDDGSYFPMNNPYHFPTSEFIPVGMEYLTEEIDHICPCSDPSQFKTCANCDNPCHGLTYGMSMALLEHSTAASKERDSIIKKAHNAIKKALGIK